MSGSFESVLWWVRGGVTSVSGGMGIGMGIVVWALLYGQCESSVSGGIGIVNLQMGTRLHRKESLRTQESKAIKQQKYHRHPDYLIESLLSSDNPT